MKIINLLPTLVDCLERWEKPPTREVFEAEYISKVGEWLSPMLEDFSGRFGEFYSIIPTLDWAAYRAETLPINPDAEVARLEKQMRGVEACLGTKLEGEAVLFGAFTMMDGYARFDRGRHRVFLGVDESHGRGNYLDVLVSHELTHVIRESRPSTWQGWGLSTSMTHDEFTENQPVIEHVFSEGFSCAISELLNPKEDPWNYCYQTQDTLAKILEHGPAVDKIVHEELKLSNKDGDYVRLYDVSRYKPRMPRFAHYAWAWRWVKQLLADEGVADPNQAARQLVTRCSKDLMEHALSFRLRS